MVENRTAIVTGSSRGIGKQVAETLAADGANVVVCSRSVEDSEEVAEGIEADGGSALAVEVDVSQKESVERLVERTVEEFGRSALA